jgi:hypothetical protein
MLINGVVYADAIYGGHEQKHKNGSSSNNYIGASSNRSSSAARKKPPQRLEALNIVTKNHLHN